MQEILPRAVDMPLARLCRPLHAVQPPSERSGDPLAGGILAVYGAYASGVPAAKGPKLDAVRSKVARVTSAALECAKARAATCSGVAPGSQGQVSVGSSGSARMSHDSLLRCSMTNGPPVCAS